MSGSAAAAASTVSSSAFAFAPVFVVQFGKRCSSNNNRRKKRRRRQDDNTNWHVCDSLCQIPSALSSSLSFLLVIFLLILCSIGGDDGVKGSEILASSAGNSNNGIPSFDATDLKNLVEMFPEFREYVQKVMSSHVNKQQQTQQQHQQQQRYQQGQQDRYKSIQYVTTTTTAPLNTPPPLTAYDADSSLSSRRDWFPYGSQKYRHSSGQKAAVTSASKLGYGWPQPEDYYSYHPQPQYDHGHHSHGYNQGYGYGTSGHSGWHSAPSHHDDHKHHYQVGYQLGKDVSCVLGLLGFKSIKDFSIHSVFSFFKKLKYLVLIGLAFKLGVILSPLALPTLLPLILLAVIAKILPLLLIVVLLFKLLKTQLKFGIGKRTGEIGVDGVSGGDFSSFLEGTNISRLWKSIEDTTQNVSENESCVEKIICQMVQKRKVNHIGTNGTSVEDEDEDEEESGRSIMSTVFGDGGIMPSFLPSVLDWVYPKRKWKVIGADSSENVWQCDQIQCDV